MIEDTHKWSFNPYFTNHTSTLLFIYLLPLSIIWLSVLSLYCIPFKSITLNYNLIMQWDAWNCTHASSIKSEDDVRLSQALLFIISAIGSLISFRRATDLCGSFPMNETYIVFKVLQFSRKSDLKSGHDPVWDISIYQVKIKLHTTIWFVNFFKKCWSHANVELFANSEEVWSSALLFFA